MDRVYPLSVRVSYAPRVTLPHPSLLTVASQAARLWSAPVPIRQQAKTRRCTSSFPHTPLDSGLPSPSTFRLAVRPVYIQKRTHSAKWAAGRRLLDIDLKAAALVSDPVFFSMQIFTHPFAKPSTARCWRGFPLCRVFMVSSSRTVSSSLPVQRWEGHATLCTACPAMSSYKSGVRPIF